MKTLKQLILVNLFTVFYFITNICSAQTVPITGIEPQTFYCPSIPKDTLNKIFIRGRVLKNRDHKTAIYKAVIVLKGTDLYTTSDSTGYYWLDITEKKEIKKKLLIQCSFVNHVSKEFLIRRRPTKTYVLNFELDLNGGIIGPETKKRRKAS